MKRSLRFFFAITMVLIAFGCSDANRNFVKKAVKIMDRSGLYATGEEWEKARKEALSATPVSMEEAHDVVKKALKVAGGKHSFLK